MKIETQVMFIISNPLQHSSQNGVLSYQYPCYITSYISNILDIPQITSTIIT